MGMYADKLATGSSFEMKSVMIFRKVCLRLGRGLVCLALSGSMLAQGAGNNASPSSSQDATKPATTNSEPTPAAADGKAHDDTFIIGLDDVLAVNVWKETEISRSVPVRSDGKISLPLVGEVQASGHTPRQLEQEIAKRLQNYISEPEVTVIVQQINSQKFNVLGQVAKPGLYPLTNSPTVLDAIGLAGGFRDFAKQKSIYILRKNPDGGQSRLPFNYKDVVKGKNPEQNVKLQPGDTVVVP
jgi:polysaccharide export outer membrane protein